MRIFDFVVLVLTIPTMAASATRPVRIKLDTVPDEYTPTNAVVAEKVSMESFHFEVNPETARARIVVRYVYPDELIYQVDDDKGGPQSTFAQVPGLRYDPKAHTVVYEADGIQTVCAQVQERKGAFGTRLRIENTGHCLVTAEHTRYAEDDGWEIRRFSAIDTYFETH